MNARQRRKAKRAIRRCEDAKMVALNSIKKFAFPLHKHQIKVMDELHNMAKKHLVFDLPYINTGSLITLRDGLNAAVKRPLVIKPSREVKP